MLHGAMVATNQLPVDPGRRLSFHPMAGRRSPTLVKLIAEFNRIGDSHPEATVRTVARAALPGSVSRVFASGTKDTLVRLLPTLDIDALAGLRDEDHFRARFERALKSVAEAILTLNPVSVNPRIHPGYDWGHGAKVLSIFVRDLVLFSRHFSWEEAKRIEPWLYCPVDGIVMDRLRELGVDPGVRYIKAMTQEGFWSIQERLGEAAAVTNLPRVWFDDVWSVPRYGASLRLIARDRRPG